MRTKSSYEPLAAIIVALKQLTSDVGLYKLVLYEGKKAWFNVKNQQLSQSAIEPRKTNLKI